MSNSKRKAKAGWFIDTKWLSYFETGDSVFCEVCRFVGPQNGTSNEKIFGVSCVTDWSYINKLHSMMKIARNCHVQRKRFHKRNGGQSKVHPKACLQSP
ncbi:hypothetical protein DPMN_010004 [Dreissena polymorpha]|uniref:TTF-type domain-containing protein n=1 Tax=Dreissena polymorpha TaxID=45954 RepID=A0A9D4RYQ6_DREPO|nr:hypothetical protein DPMN_010004 [Dreissena polymorpha]